MTTKVYVELRKWIIGTMLFAGIAYSLPGVINTPVHASSCDCDEDDAVAGQDFCATHLYQGTIASWTCPDPTTPGYFDVYCQHNFTGQVYGPFDVACQ